MPVALALSLGAVACSGSDDNQADVKSSAGATETTAAIPSRPSDSTRETVAESRGEPIATTQGINPADPNDSTPVPLRLDIISAERGPGEVVKVLFTITNLSGDKEVTYGPWRTLSDGTANDYDVGGATLLDLPNDKVYLPLRDSNDTCLCSGGLSDVEIAPGTSLPMNVSFPAPPQDVKTVDFTLPGFDPANGLSLS